MSNENKDISLQDFLNDNVAEAQSNTTAEPVLSPLEQMVKNTTLGVIVDNAEITRDNEIKHLKNFTDDNPRRNAEFDAYLENMDEQIKVAQELQLTKKPTNQMEDVAMMHQLDSIARERTGTLAPEIKETDPEKVELIKANIEEKFNMTDDKLGDNLVIGHNESDFLSQKDYKHVEVLPKEVQEKLSVEELAQYKERVNQVEILIDKTGLGMPIEFTDEEKEKLSVATEIRLIEIESLELESIEFEAPETSYVETMDVMDMDINGTISIPLTASRYSARVKGLGYGQLGDLMLDEKSPTFEQFYKRFSTIYNSITWTSIGAFSSFEDFLKRTAFIDMNFFLYAIIVKTYPDIDNINMTCGSCGRSFEQAYATRELLDLAVSTPEYLEQLGNLIKTEPSNYETYAKESTIYKRKKYKLPYSNMIIEVGTMSAYDYLYTIAANTSGDSFERNHPDDVNKFLKGMAEYLPFIHSISIKNGLGKYTKYTAFEDMIQILYRNIPEELPIINTIMVTYSKAFLCDFSIRKSTCPHCGYASTHNSIELDQLIFFKLRRLMTTTVNEQITLHI